LDLFGVPPTQTSVEHGYWEQKGLTSTLTDQGPYEFAVSGAGDDYIDLFNTYLFVEAQIVNTDGSNLDPDKDGGTQLYLCHIQSHFLNLDFIIGRVCHESKSVKTSSQFNLQIGRQIPTKPLQPDFENNGYIRSYMGLYTSTGKMDQDEGVVCFWRILL
jgi:hypothetical protein